MNWETVKKYGAWALAVVGLLFLGIYLALRQGGGIALRLLKGKETLDIKQKELELSTEKKEAEILAKEGQEVAQAKQEHSEAVGHLDEEQKKTYESLKHDPVAVNAWLHQVGKAVREQK